MRSTTKASSTRKLQERIRKLEQDLARRDRADAALQALLHATASTVGESFFPTMVEHIASALGTAYVIVSRVLDPKLERAETLAFWSDGRLGSNFVYDLDRTPCGRVLQEGVRRMQFAIDHSSDSVFWVRRDSTFCYVNREAGLLLGYSQEELTLLGVGDIDPDFDAARWPDKFREIRDAGSLTWEGRHRTNEGRIIPTEITASHVAYRGKEYLCAFCRDITERRAVERRQQLMMNELDHRVKNNLSAVLAMLHQTVATAESLEEFTASFSGRLQTLAHAHDALAASKWRGVDVAELVELTLATYADRERRRFTATGPKSLLNPRASLPIGMALHELAINAAKHGGLSNLDGRVEVRWAHDDHGMLSLTWTERGGPPTSPPIREGYGLQVIRGAIEHELAGRVDLEFAADGLRCVIEVPAVVEQDASSGPTAAVAT